MRVYPALFSPRFRRGGDALLSGRKNIIGIHESSEKALRIMQITPSWW